MTPDISIIIPVYNTAAYLPDTIASLQALDDSVGYEFICVDDGSTDDSLAILRHWADSDPRVQVFTQANQGQSVARNEALRHVTGQWLYCLDSDDMLMHDALSGAYNEATRLGADMLLFSGTIINENGELIDEVEGTVFHNQRYIRPKALPADTVLDGEDVMRTLLDNFIFRAVPWLYLVRTDFLRQTGITFLPGIIHEDELFTASLTLACRRIAVLHHKAVLHRIRQTSTMGTRFSRRNMDCYLAVIDGMTEWTRNNPERRTMAWRYCAYTLNHVLITARSLPLSDRWTTLLRIIRSGYLPFVEPRRLIQFIYGR